MYIYKFQFNLLVFISFAGKISAQTISSQVISTAGEFYQTLDYSLQTTLAELQIQTLANSTNTLTQGFEQSELIINSVVTPISEEEIKIYPNPTASEVYVKVMDAHKVSQIIISDALGRIQPVFFEANNNIINCNLTALSSGSYFLQIIFKDSDELFSFKIIKTIL